MKQQKRTTFLGTLSMFSVVTVCASIKYGKQIRWSLLDSLPTSTFLHMAAFLVALQLSLTSAISNSALYQHVEDCMGIAREFNHRRCIIRTVLIILAIVLAESVPRFDLVMSMIGGTLTGPIVFVLPPLFFIRMHKIKKEYEKTLKEEAVVNLDSTLPTKEDSNEDGPIITGNKLEIVISAAVMIFGFFGIAATTYVNIVNTIQYASFSRPCIYNLTMYLT